MKVKKGVVYFIRKTLIDYETRYTPIEKIFLFNKKTKMLFVGKYNML